MITIKTRITGIEDFERVIRRGMRIEPVMNKALRAGAKELAGKISRYPPAMPNQVYVRTGNLGRSWVRPPQQTSMMQWTFGNSMSYAERVMGMDQLRFFAERGWKSVDRHIQEEAPAVVAKVIRAVEQELS